MSKNIQSISDLITMQIDIPQDIRSVFILGLEPNAKRLLAPYKLEPNNIQLAVASLVNCFSLDDCSLIINCLNNKYRPQAEFLISSAETKKVIVTGTKSVLQRIGNLRYLTGYQINNIDFFSKTVAKTFNLQDIEAIEIELVK